MPAAPDAWITALRDYGTMGFGDVAAAAIRIAATASPCSSTSPTRSRRTPRATRSGPATRALFLPGGRPPRVGERFVQRDLAATIQHMVDEERSAAGGGREAGLEAARAAFYVGDIARQIAELPGRERRLPHSRGPRVLPLALRAGGAHPLARLRRADVRAVVPGAGARAGARALERAALEGPSFDDPRHVHLVLEVLKGAFADREYRYGDPAFVDVGLEELLSTAHADARLAAIDPARADAGDAGAARAPGRPRRAPAADARHVRRAPARHVVRVRRRRCGKAFSACRPTARTAARSSPGSASSRPSAASSRAPTRGIPPGSAGRRPRLTPNPAMAVRDDGSLLVIGCPGGDMQVQAMLQVVLNAFVFGMDVQQAIDAPRYSTWSFPNSFAPHEYLPGRLCWRTASATRCPTRWSAWATRSCAGPPSHARRRRSRRSTPTRRPASCGRARPAAARLRHRGMSQAAHRRLRDLRIPIPRYREINERLAQGILRRAARHLESK